MDNNPAYILGISAFYHDSSACLLKDGEIVAAAVEERFSRIKHDASFPKKAIEFCLRQAGITINNIQYIAYYEKPILKFDRILNSFIKNSPKGFIPFKMGIKSWLTEKLWVSSIIKKELKYKGELKFCKHHESHAASSYFTSPFTQSAFLTIDGVGEKATTTYGIASNNKIQTLKEIHFPHSLGLLYSAFTYYCGFKVNSGEYKLMGLAPYGTPKYAATIKQYLITINDDGSFILNMEYFPFEKSLKMINQKFCDLFSHPARTEDSEINQFYKDIAASIQQVTEEVILLLAKQVKHETEADNLCLAGGVALNCVANHLLQTSGIFKNYWIQPAAGDSGNSIGAALLVWHQNLNNPKTIQQDRLAIHSYLGPSSSNREIVELLENQHIIFDKPEPTQLSKLVADMLNQKAVIGWYSGKMEFGPRALGNRSILASPVYKDMKKHVNLKIKNREGFRPFAPIVLEEFAQDWFEMPKTSKSMLYTYQCKQAEKIPSCVHVDNSSRVQTISESDNPKIHQLITDFHSLSDCPVLINTSFNVRGEPIVNTPNDALTCFFNTDMDALVLENFLILKNKQANRPEKAFNNRNKKSNTIHQFVLKISTNKKKQQQFLWLIALIMALVYGFGWYKGQPNNIFIFTALTLISISFIYPKLASPLLYVWMYLGKILNEIMSTIILAFIFFFGIVPIGFFNKNKDSAPEWKNSKVNSNFNEQF